jgi:hypothetical protein
VTACATDETSLGECARSRLPGAARGKFFRARTSGVLQLNAKQAAREEEEAILRRAAELREGREAAEFNEDAAYGMSMADLEARCRGWK